MEVIQATGGSHVTSVMSGDAWGVIGGVDSNAIPNASGNCPDPVIAVCNCVNRANVYLCAAVGEEYTGNTDEELAQYFKRSTPADLAAARICVCAIFYCQLDLIRIRM